MEKINRDAVIYWARLTNKCWNSFIFPLFSLKSQIAVRAATYVITNLCIIICFLCIVINENYITQHYSMHHILFSGIGVLLVLVSAVAWRLTNQDYCGSLFGFTGISGRIPPARPIHPYAAMIYPEFQFRTPPPSYQVLQHFLKQHLLEVYFVTCRIKKYIQM